MSRRIKPDRRNVVDRNTILKITRVVEHPGVPETLVATLIRVRDFLWRAGGQLTEEDFRYDFHRECMAYDLCWLGEDIDYMLKELRLISNDWVG